MYSRITVPLRTAQDGITIQREAITIPTRVKRVISVLTRVIGLDNYDQQTQQSFNLIMGIAFFSDAYFCLSPSFRLSSLALLPI